MASSTATSRPDNVLLSSGSATVTDFGDREGDHRRAHRRLTQKARHSPRRACRSETRPTWRRQALGDPDTDHRADLYAFGVMAYELIGGRLPFQGNSPSKLLAAHMGGPPPDLLEVRPDVRPRSRRS